MAACWDALPLELRKLVWRARAAGMLDDLVREGGRLHAARLALLIFECDRGGSFFRRSCARNGWHWKHRHADKLQREAQDLFNRSLEHSYKITALKSCWMCDLSGNGTGVSLKWFFTALPDIASRGGELLPIRPCLRMDALRSALHVYRRRIQTAECMADEFGARLDAFVKRFQVKLEFGV